MAKTIDEIAKETGFSRTTITLVLNGQADQYRISARTQAAVRDYVAQHGITINYAARSLKLRRSETVGFVAPDMTNAFFARLMTYLEVHCRDNGLVLLATSTYEDPATERRALENLRARNVDGIVLAACSPPDTKVLADRKRRIPVVLVDREYPESNLPTVASSHFASALTIALEMLSLVPEGLAMLCGHEENPSIKDRLRGFRQAVAERSLSPTDVRIMTSGDDTAKAGWSMMDELVNERGGLPPAILCSSLLVLEGAMQRVRQEAGGVPSDMVIGTFDYQGLLEVLPNTVLLMRQNESGLAAAVFRCLKAQMDGKPLPFQLQTLPMEIVRLGRGIAKTQSL